MGELFGKACLLQCGSFAREGFQFLGQDCRQGINALRGQLELPEAMLVSAIARILSRLQHLF
jgi:hypothetical protein